MTRSELIDRLASRLPHLTRRDVELSTTTILELMSSALAEGERIEVRGFGSFAVRERASRMGRNPRTGQTVALPVRRVVHFRAGRELRDRIERSAPSAPVQATPVVKTVEQHDDAMRAGAGGGGADLSDLPAAPARAAPRSGPGE